jgi:hypothetical protein
MTIPSLRPSGYIRINLGETSNRTGHHNAALAQDDAGTSEICHCIAGGCYRQLLGAGVAMNPGQRW